MIFGSNASPSSTAMNAPRNPAPLILPTTRPAPATFPLGRILITAHAAAVLAPADVQTALARHAAGDWGEVSGGDWALNESALAAGDRLLSVYHDARGHRFWIITEAGRDATTILLPEDY